MLEAVGPVRLVSAIVETTLMAQRGQRIPGRLAPLSGYRPVSRRRARCRRAEGRASRLPAIRVPEPLGPRRLANTARASSKHKRTNHHTTSVASLVVFFCSPIRAIISLSQRWLLFLASFCSSCSLGEYRGWEGLVRGLCV